MKERPLSPGRSSEAEFLSRVGFWFVSSQEARAHAARIKKFKAKGLIGMRRHRRNDGEVTDAYELTDSGLARLEDVAGGEAAAVARSHRDYLRDQARKQRVS